MSLSDLPEINAALNSFSTLFLLAGFYFIRRKNVKAHRNCMISALGASLLFLVCYLTYHYQVGHTVFRDPAWFRPFYLGLLASHVLLAALIVPLVLVTVVRAAKGNFEKHKKIARWTWPIWLYVSITGVVIYWILYHLFPQAK